MPPSAPTTAERPTTTATASTVAINGYALRVIRKLSNLTPASLAESIDRDRSYVAHIESGRVGRVSTATFDALLQALAIEDRRALLAFPHGS